MKRLLLVTFFFGCGQLAGSDAPVPHEMKCANVGPMYRCESDEVVCYSSAGLQCKWKESK